MIRRRRRVRPAAGPALGVAWGVSLLASFVPACTSTPSTRPSADSSTRPSAVASSSSAPVPATRPDEVLFSPQGNNLEAYDIAAPFAAQRVSRAHKAIPPDTNSNDGWDINGQI